MAMTPVFYNNKSFVVTHEITPTTTVLHVAANHGIRPLSPGKEYIVGTIIPRSGEGDLEIIHIIGVDDTTFIIERGKEETNPQSYLFGAVLELRLTAESIRQMGAQALREDLLDSTTPENGAGMVGYHQDIDYPSGTVGRELVELRDSKIKPPASYGYITATSNLDTETKVSDNWAKMKEFILNMDVRSLASIPKPILTLHDVYAKWAAGEHCPIGFYSDSTTDGATTTGHVPSTPDPSSFGVIINESPNAYPAVMKDYLDRVLNSTSATVYNGGFDSQSFANGFGLKHWYNTWFRAAGSNKDWTDVKLIVIGFGTSDSMNDGNVKEIADRYALDLECVIIDCLLRGVTPVLQGPVPTAQSTATAVLGRKGRESITIIETIQKRLCDKYGLEWLSYREAFEDAIYHYQTIKYIDLMAPDMVHPTDTGHAVHAGYLLSKIVPNVLIFDGSPESLYCGSQFWNYPSYMNISPQSAGGTILKRIVPTVVAADSFFYGWRQSEGNGVAKDQVLLRAFVYCKKPCELQEVAVLSSGNKHNFGLYGVTKKETIGGTVAGKVGTEAGVTYSRYAPLTRLPFGFSILVFTSGEDGDANFFGARLVSPKETGRTLDGFGTAGALYLKSQSEINQYGNPPNVLKDYLPEGYFDKQYSISDNVVLSVVFEMLRGGASCTFKTHFNSISSPLDSHLELSYAATKLELFAVVAGVKTSIGEAAGTFPALAAGDIVEISFLTRYYSGSTTQVSIHRNGVFAATIEFTPNNGWKDGIGASSSINSRVFIRSATAMNLISDVHAYV